MENFSKHAFAFALGVCMVAAGIFIWQTHNDKAQEAHASEADNVSGYAWSENIGWISFNNTDASPGGIGYGVSVDTVTGNFSGYAWSEHIGWINFAPAGPYPSNPQSSANLNISNGQASGWARAVAGGSGGWDGWIKLAKKSPGDSGPNYGVTYNRTTKEFEGWAWGSDVVGWISFNSVTDGSGQPYAVKGSFNTDPSVSNLSTSTLSVCSSPTYQQFSWTFSDVEDNISQTSYTLQIDTNNGFNSPVYSYTGTSSQILQVPVSTTAVNNSSIAFNTPYFWRVQVLDTQGASSGWSNGPQFTTPQNPLPSVNFTWRPSIANISENEEVSFTDSTNFYSSTKSWSWVITNATYQNGTNATSQNPVVTFNTVDEQSATLTATNNIGSCAVNKSLGSIKTPLPKFKEVKPQ